VTRARALPVWAPAAAAVVIGLAMQSLWIRPMQARIVDVERRLSEERAQAGTIAAQIARDRGLPVLPSPLTRNVFDRRWPGIIAGAQAAGYTFQAVTFAAAPPLSVSGAPSVPAGPGAPSPVEPAGLRPSGGAVTPAPPAAPRLGPAQEPIAAAPPQPVTPIDITARLAGAYLPLDETLSSMQRVLPLWSWRSLHIAAQQDAAGVTVTVEGVVPIDGPARQDGRPVTPPLTPAPPPPPGSRP